MILKRKIAKARLRLGKKHSTSQHHLQDKVEMTGCQKYQDSLRLKNVYKNFTRAICNFILSEISTPYLQPIAEELNIGINEFREFIGRKREEIRGVIELRGFLISQSQDSLKLSCFKKAFQKMAEIFIKFFAANWICSSKLEYKLDYLKFRHHLLKKVKNPSLLHSKLV